MSFVAFALLAACLMSACCWSSNIWPGHATLLRAAVSRVMWWGLPIGLICWSNGAPAWNAVILGVAAWAGSWIPHVEFPADGADLQVILLETAVSVLRVAALLAPEAAVFWVCGAYWPAMPFAVFSAVGCMYAAVRLPRGSRGMRTNKEIYGVLLGASVGFWLAVAVWTPTQAPDLLP